MSPAPDPPLSPEVVADEQSLWAAIEQVICSDSALDDLARLIVGRQRQLRRMVGDQSDAWLVYLGVEQATTERLERAAVRIALWAFEQGRRSVGPPP